MLNLDKVYGKFLSVVETESDALLLVNEQGQILHANTIFQKWLARSSLNVLPETLSEVLDSRVWNRYASRLRNTVLDTMGVQFSLKTWLPCRLQLNDFELNIEFSILGILCEDNGQVCLIRARIPQGPRIHKNRLLHRQERSSSIPLPRARVLVVEDSPDNTTLIECYFRNTPLQMDHAANGMEAVKMVPNGRYDLILMDLHMPVMDGYSATHEIRQWESKQGLHSRMPIYALSAFTFRENIEKAIAVGMDGYLAKPIKRGVLLREISRILQFRGMEFWNSMEAAVAKS